MVELYATAKPVSIELLIIASFKDAAQFVREHEQLFKEKTRSVTVMGGVMPFEDDDDETTLLVPDTVGLMQSSVSFPRVLSAPRFLAQAHNNQFDVEGSDYFYRRCQELRVPMIVVSRHAAYACPMPRSIYGMCRDRIAKYHCLVITSPFFSPRPHIQTTWPQQAIRLAAD